MSFMELITDPYNRRSRLQPALVAILPICLVGLLLFPEAETRAVTFITILAYFGGSVLLTQLGRERGKNIEPTLFKEWGGKPSVTLIRHRDERLNSVTKARYHQFLVNNVPHFILPSVEEEDEDELSADTMYQTATDWLLSKTRDTNKFRLIFEENMNYGFRRNLYALKPIALVIDIALALLLIVVAYSGEGVISDDILRSIMSIDSFIYLSFGVVVLHAIALIAIVTKRWIKTTADAFGVQLLSACDELS
ncbi:MAG: hypothetical protein AB2669_00560 [Candidatus Thiodiazotropha endolucinida]